MSEITTFQNQIDFMICTGCNASCPFCVQESTYKPEDNNDYELNLKKAVNWFDKLGFEKNKVIITGGEPLLKMSRTIKTIKECRKALGEKLEILALYTNTSVVMDIENGLTLAEALKVAELGSLNISRHQIEDQKNQVLMKLAKIPSIQSLTKHLNEIQLPFRFNLVIQKNAIETADQILEYVSRASDYGVKDVYCRDTFIYPAEEISRFRNLQSLYKNPSRVLDSMAYSNSNHLDLDKIISNLRVNKNCEFISVNSENRRNKTEYKFKHSPSGIYFYISKTELGTENKESPPYLVYMPNGNLYKGWLGEEDWIKI
jgi:organic radical activating enzyme